ncbi:ATP-dependent RNA helicase DBP7 [Trichoderma asperellum]|uniref:ATP-dependent RNA helicase n=1 Tax=Trichoderma asperellum TaxID=101201 RepID=A0A6V8QQ40_TRIAP|nr:P-loop containing nucleoside triphosphate hydrolase protein [Trichoderma asperelloides]GFP53288.1 ATP-dependent RNA helicase DBP7 [Trichoderma asperellum]
MADDGMLMNFELGGGPLKPQVKFKGGSWRDRKRAEKSAKLGSRPAGAARGPDDEQRSAKRQKIDGFGSGRRTEGELPYRSDLVRKKTADHGAPGQKKHAGPPGNRQVVSRLFSFNPEQKTTFEEEEEWKEPEPTNAPLLTVANFGSLTISSRLVEALAKMNLERPTAIQQKVIPHMLSSSSDAFVQAETGSGKTFSYLLPILHRVLLLSGSGEKIHRDSGVFAIIVSPTRELAKQTHTVLEQLIRPFPWLVSTAITGGESKKAEKARLRKGINFLVATPGRLADHIDNTKALNLGTVRWLILDEGDRLMDLGFEEDLKKAIEALKQVKVSNTLASGVSLEPLPDRRVTVLCSATMKLNVQKLGEMSLADATFLAVEKGAETVDEKKDEQAVHKAPAQLHQSHIIVPAKLRLVTLMAYLKSVFSRRGHTMKAIIFMSCAHTVDFHYELLRIPENAEAPQPASKDAPSKETPSKETPSKTAQSKDSENVSKTVAKAAYITSAASPEVVLHRMHGSLSQPVRTATLKSFSACKSPSLLITTDVSSRGLDIPSVDLVIEYDPAFSFDDHIHRIGRTARAGRSGDATIFLLPGAEEGYIELLKASGSPSSLSYESVLQKGLMTKLEFPVETTAKPQDGQTYHDKAETLQLHLEQRLLLDSKRLELARNGFKSHIRAYATHTKEERVHFDITQLHLGHVAKAFGLRDPPGGIGAGIERKAQKGKKEHWRTVKGGKKDDDSDGDDAAKLDQKPARDALMRKSRMLMSGASEFNIG